jgi:hypothetical protein
MSLLELFCDVDDFWQCFQPHWEQEMLRNGSVHRLRQGQLSVSEVMTIMIHFHQSHYRHFKAYYTEYVQVRLPSEFPQLVGYGRFVPLMPRVLVPLGAYLVRCYGQCTGVSFIDSTPIAVCHHRRILSHRVLAGSAAGGKSSVGWFFGFKLHLVVNDLGELLACRLTPGNIDDRSPVPTLVQRVFGKLFGDRGYLSYGLFAELFERGIQLVTQLKNISQIEHTRHRSLANFMVNLVSGLIAYCHQPKKPSIRLDTHLMLPSIA